MFSKTYTNVYINRKSHPASSSGGMALPTSNRLSSRFDDLNTIQCLTEEPPKDFKEVAISRDAGGNYYASFPTEVEVATQDETEQAPEVVAFDLGIKTHFGYTGKP